MNPRCRVLGSYALVRSIYDGLLIAISTFSRIIELCHQFPHGITDQVIQNDMPHMEAQQRAMAINRLLSMVRTSSTS